jgi:hypothetical protein
MLVDWQWCLKAGWLTGHHIMITGFPWKQTMQNPLEGPFDHSLLIETFALDFSSLL